MTEGQTSRVVDSVNYACSLCAEIQRSRDGSLLHDLLDDWGAGGYVLLETEHFSVVPAVGSCVDGYVLVLPKAHVFSFGLVNSAFEVEFQNLLVDLRRILHSAFGGACLIFEHGARSSRSRAGSCADHAHLHVVPIQASVDLRSPFKAEFDVRIVEHTLAELRAQVLLRGRPYLALIVDRDGMLIADAPSARSQYFRRILFQDLGRQGEWDWLVFPGVDHMRRTLRVFRHIHPAAGTTGG